MSVVYWRRRRDPFRSPAERDEMPSRRALILAGLATLLLVGAVDVPALAPATLAIDAALALAVVLDARRAARTRVAAVRRWPELPVQGVSSDVVVRLSCSGGRPLRLALRDALHPSLASQPPRHDLVLPSREEVVWSYPLEPLRRGQPQAGPLTARVLGPWGLGWSQRELLAPERLRVYPKVRWDGRVGQLLRLADRRELGQAPLRTHGLGREPYALREYRPGDPLSRIHWKATARHARLVSREDTWERGMRLVVLLDCARAMASVDEARSKLDHALAASLALARVALSRGDQTTVIAVSDRVERVSRLRPGAGAVSVAYRDLFDLEARLVEPAYDAAADAVSRLSPRRSTVVMLTSVVDLAAVERLSEVAVGLARRHRTILVNLQDPDVTSLAMGAPESAGDAFAKAAALEILLANRRLARRLRRAGLSVATTPADRLAWDTLVAYLDLNRGGLRRAA